MIKILKYGEVENNAIFARTNEKANVEKTVSEINPKRFLFSVKTQIILQEQPPVPLHRLPSFLS